MEALRPWHLLIVAAFFFLLFGAKRLPDMARSLGRSARIMKSELKDLQEESPASPGVRSTGPERPMTEKVRD